MNGATTSTDASQGGERLVDVDHLTMAYGDYVVQRELTFSVVRSQIFVVMGDSGSGKSTLLRHMIGLEAPRAGDVFYRGQAYWNSPADVRERLRAKFGVLFQGGALLSSLTLGENVGLPLVEHLRLDPRQAREVAATKLALVGLAGCEDHYPDEVSGGMKNRAGLARSLALDPEIVFLDEPSAGLDPLSARRLDDLVLELRDSLGTTFIVVTHELPSIFAIADDSIFLDGGRHVMAAQGNPRELLASSPDPKVRAFLARGRLP
ncbi:MAG TPA: ATP-binding cassette domain-containing protein [Anaeromyxobacteraceae bacterium]|nr:ATP-binding cassette domain-containing protein [Anaeromyxobacteraceae bacterium]